MLDVTPKILTGSSIQLEPLTASHKDELYSAAQDESIWTYNSSTALGEQFYIWFEKAILYFQKKEALPFIVRRLSDNQIIGSTRYYDIYPAHHRLSMGYTWYIPAVWGTGVNLESKFLLLKFAFEDLHVNRIEFSVDSRNARSLAAIKKIGATQEGILRHHMILKNGFIRDAVLFSIIKTDWPTIESMLQSRLNTLKG